MERSGADALGAAEIAAHLHVGAAVAWRQRADAGADHAPIADQSGIASAVRSAWRAGESAIVGIEAGAADADETARMHDVGADAVGRRTGRVGAARLIEV